MSTIFLQQILSGRLLLLGQKSNFSVRFKFESITTNHLRFVVKCYKNVVDIASLFLQYFHNKLQVVSCYWFKFKSATKITFFPSIITTSNNLSPMICYKNVIVIAFLFFCVLSNSHAISTRSIWNGSQKSVVRTSYRIYLVNKSLIHVMNMQIMSQQWFGHVMN